MISKLFGDGHCPTSRHGEQFQTPITMRVYGSLRANFEGQRDYPP